MTGRLGNVLYWIGCALAALTLIFGAIMFFVMSRSGNTSDVSGAPVVAGVFMAAALVIWTLGRACRYILSGK